MLVGVGRRLSEFVSRDTSASAGSSSEWSEASDSASSVSSVNERVSGAAAVGKRGTEVLDDDASRGTGEWSRWWIPTSDSALMSDEKNHLMVCCCSVPPLSFIASPSMRVFCRTGSGDIQQCRTPCLGRVCSLSFWHCCTSSLFCSLFWWSQTQQAAEYRSFSPQ
jgi:hypothetical protein